MKTEKNILIAFLLNLAFSIFEFVGGMFTGSISIASDALHDIGDTMSIGIAYFLEKKSKRQPDDIYTYGYSRYSVVGGAITTLILLIGSFAVIVTSVYRIIEPRQVNGTGMIIFAVIGALVNLCAAFFTRGGNSLNQRAVNLHMLEDVLGWVVVLVGAIVIRFTEFSLIDPIMSVCVAIFIFVGALKNLKSVLDIFLEKVPSGICTNEIKEHLLELDEVIDIHHIHIWSMDTENNHATMHVVANGDTHKIKHMIREALSQHGINHVTIEFEYEGEHCHSQQCEVRCAPASACHHHHHHH